MTMNSRRTELAALERPDLDVDDRDEGDVGPVQRVREAALVALRRQGDVADDDVAVGFELDSFDPPLDVVFPHLHLTGLPTPSLYPSRTNMTGQTIRTVQLMSTANWKFCLRPGRINPANDGRTAARRRRDRTAPERVVGSMRDRGARIRTGDLGHPKAARYQAAPRPEATSVGRPHGRGSATARFRGRGRRPPHPRAALRPRASSARCGDVAAPPYDVIDTELRAELLARSPYNAVAIDLPKPYGQSGPEDGEGDPYATAAADDRRPGARPAPWSTTPSRRSGR